MALLDATEGELLTEDSGSAGARIPRQPVEAASKQYDLVIVGGGIYGVALAFEAARRDYRTLLLDRDDFGSGTSWSSLRIIHGGLRYLQTLDLSRFRESVAERRWFLRHFPDLVRPLPCLMPLYGYGLKRPSFFRIALACNDLLSLDRNWDLEARARLARGEVLSRGETLRLFPQAGRHGLRGGALWWDAVMLSSERVLMELLGWACSCGATALNYVEVERILIEHGRITGVEARDRAADRVHRYAAGCVVNVTGPRARAFAQRIDPAAPALFWPTLAFNLLIDRAPPAEVAIAVQPRREGQIYFVLPWKGRTLAGTFHAGLPHAVLEPTVGADQVAQFVGDLNAAIPGLDLAPEQVLHVYAGLLPGRHVGSAELAKRAVIHDHGSHGGPRGFYTISGVKFTTARRVAEDTLRAIFGRQLRPASSAPARPRPLLDFAGQTLLSAGTPCGSESSERDARARRIIREEAVVRSEDLLLRRFDSAEALGDRSRASEAFRGVLGSALPEAGSPPPVSH